MPTLVVKEKMRRRNARRCPELQEPAEQAGRVEPARQHGSTTAAKTAQDAYSYFLF